MLKLNLILLRLFSTAIPHKYRFPFLYTDSTMRAMYSVISDCHTETYLTRYGRIPVKKLEIKYLKSSGPGGQNVNKLNTKVQIRFDINEADWLPPEVKQAVLVKHKNKFTKEGVLLLESQATRSQFCNERDAIIKLQSIIERACTVPGITSQAKRMKIRDIQENARERRKMFKQCRKRRKSDPYGFL